MTYLVLFSSETVALREWTAKRWTLVRIIDGTGDSAANCPKRVSFEDALTLAKFGRFNYALIAIAGTVLAAVMLEMLSISYVIAVAECDLELTSGQKGILGAMALAGTIAGSHLWGFLADTLGRRKVIIPTLLMTNAVSFASSMMTNFWMITICRFLTGFFQIQLILGEAEVQPSRDHSKGVKAVLELIWNQTAPLFKRPYLHKTILMCFLQFGTYITAHGMFMFFPGLLDQLVKAQEAGIDRITLCDIVYAHNPLEASGQSTCTQSLSLATYGYSITLDIIYVLGFLVIGLLVNAVGRLAILVFVFTGCGACGVLAILVDIPLLSMWLYIMMMMSGFTVSVVSAVTVDLFPTSLRAMAVGISLMCGRIGGVFGTNLAGLLLDSQCELTFGITCSILLLCSVLSFFIPNINKKVQPESS
ncbi:synaptic vesicle protein [Culex quinquefasciatus]|uniref:Synaptic vesicle protein n=1 Tax=Culex quinquefasciatus TaxID=7176 RepID=B0X2G1_CULQU|nr:synaptic vesicle protein [Culex quinquefasciatus]|eukprot:XP_001863833.1 synaptic vesicle protein [Culex quinquefasciatus]